MSRGALALAAALAVGTPLQAQATWFGELTLSSERVERGQAESEGQPSAAASLGWRFDSSGLYAALGLATVSAERYAGGSGIQLQSRLGWRRAEDSWHVGTWIARTVYPGARRSRRPGTEPAGTDYSTTEFAVHGGWTPLTLSMTRSLSSYRGLPATSRGTTYVALDLALPVGERWTADAGIGRLHVPGAGALSYTDWRLGATLEAAGLAWALGVSGSDASAQWRLLSRSDRSTRVTASVSWLF